VLKDVMEKYKTLLNKKGIDFMMLKDEELCCGSPLKNAGMQQEYLETARKNMALFKAHSIGRIISNCPACTAVLRKDYQELLKEEWEMEVLHISEVLTAEAGAGKKGEVTYHDPCHLGRALGIYDQPRDLLCKKGYQIKEMKFCREVAICCGGGGGIKSNNPELAGRIAKDRIAQARQTGAPALVTPCPMCYVNLKQNAEGIEVRELSELLE
jgi:Fe-S oxidoreductase